MLNVNKATDQVDSRAKPCYGKPVSVQKLVVSGRHGGRLPMPPLMRRTWLSIFFVCASKIQTPARAARGRQNVFAFLLSSFWLHMRKKGIKDKSPWIRKRFCNHIKTTKSLLLVRMICPNKVSPIH